MTTGLAGVRCLKAGDAWGLRSGGGANVSGAGFRKPRCGTQDGHVGIRAGNSGRGRP